MNKQTKHFQEFVIKRNMRKEEIREYFCSVDWRLFNNNRMSAFEAAYAKLNEMWFGGITTHIYLPDIKEIVSGCISLWNEGLDPETRKAKIRELVMSKERRD